MILHRDGLIELDFATVQDILYVNWQKTSPYSMEELRNAFLSVVGCVREYPTRNILLNYNPYGQDFSQREFSMLIAQLALHLKTTAIEKVARISSSNREREAAIEAAFATIKATVRLPQVYKAFSSRAEALQWLIA